MNISDILFAIVVGSCGLVAFVGLLYIGIGLITKFNTDDKIFGILICLLGIIIILLAVASIFRIVETKTAVQIMIEGGA